MRRPMIIVVFLCLACYILPQAWASERGALFKVDGAGHSMYLFGTMHVGLPEFYPLEPRLAGALADASVLALEIDPLQDPADLTRSLQAVGMLAEGAPAADLASPLKERLARALAQAHIDPAATTRYKPWLVATVLALAEFSAQGYRGELSVDLYLAQQAHAGKLPVLALESVEAQLGLFNRLSNAEQWRFLEDSLDVIESGRQRAEVRQIVDAWRHADQAGLERIAAQAEADQSLSGKFVQQVLIDGRNGALAEQLAALLKRQDKALAAIGVLHLVGRHSVPALLRAQGLTVERIY